MQAYDTYRRLFPDLLEGNTSAREKHEFRIPAEVYYGTERFERERALMKRVPIPIAHVSQLAEPGACLAHDALGVPLLITRDKRGGLNGFLNVCRHRGTRLVEKPGFCAKRGLVCPYHSWSYGLDGELVHVPNRDAFPTLDAANHALAPVPVTERGGFVWVVATPDRDYDFDAFLSPIEGELDELGLSDHVVYRESHTRHRTNWKLVVDAFLDGYHINKLHRGTVGPFFKQYLVHAEQLGLHIRSLVSRSNFVELVKEDPSTWDVRAMVSPSYQVFPNSTVVIHPDFISRMTYYPASPDEIEWAHTMLIPEAPKTPEAEAHWAKSWELIEGGVFQSEDLWVSEQIQIGLRSGANEYLHFGGLEVAVEWFHLTLAEQLGVPLDTSL